MLPGASTLFYKNDPLTPAILQELRDAGMECVELADYHPNWSYLKVAWLRQLRSDLADCGLSVNSVHTHIAWYDPELLLSHVDSARRERAVEAHLRAVDALAMIDCPILLTHDIVIPTAAEAGEEEHHRRRALFVEALGRVADYAATAGIQVAIENTTRGYAADTHVLRGIIADAGRDNIGIVVDTGHANLFPPADAHIRAAGKRLITLQIDDSSDHANQHILPGRGTTDWAALMRALVEVDYAVLRLRAELPRGHPRAGRELPLADEPCPAARRNRVALSPPRAPCPPPLPMRPCPRAGRGGTVGAFFTVKAAEHGGR
ncbi:MAG: sugar phosphate isomerase/epimerase family protein [Dehalococcoidia bacterium]